MHLNLFPGRVCGSAPSNPDGEGTPAPGFPCSNGDLAWPEDSQGFLDADLAAHASGPGVMVITLQHYGATAAGGARATPPWLAYCWPHTTTGFDSFSNTWYNVEVRPYMLPL